MRARIARAQLIVAALQRGLSWLPPAAARLTAGWVFAESGWGKLQNLEGVTQFFASLGIPAPEIQAPLVAVTELTCGTLLLAGLATRLASIPLICVMIVALATALADRIETLSDLFALPEFCYIVLLVGLSVLGPGVLSVDARIARRLQAIEEVGTGRTAKATAARTRSS